jgi:hypothetical protein
MRPNPLIGSKRLLGFGESTAAFTIMVVARKKVKNYRPLPFWELPVECRRR